MNPGDNQNRRIGQESKVNNKLLFCTFLVAGKPRIRVRGALVSGGRTHLGLWVGYLVVEASSGRNCRL